MALMQVLTLEADLETFITSRTEIFSTKFNGLKPF